MLENIIFVAGSTTVAQGEHRHLHACQEAVPTTEHALREAQERAQECAAAVDAARADHDDACIHAAYHDSLSHLMKQAADSAMDTLHHERKALVRPRPDNAFASLIPYSRRILKSCNL